MNFKSTFFISVNSIKYPLGYILQINHKEDIDLELMFKDGLVKAEGQRPDSSWDISNSPVLDSFNGNLPDFQSRLVKRENSVKFILSEE
jgi:hypothetical protein